MSLSSLITDFLEYMEIERGRSINSVKNYDRYLRHFAYYAKENGFENPEDINLDLIRKYRLYLNRDDKGKATQNYYLIALRSYLKYLAKKNIKSLDANQIELAKTDERQITFLTDKELEEILAKPDLKTIQGQRDKAIMELLFSTGLRVSELANLKKKDINLDKNEFSIKGKGGKMRVVFIDDKAKESLKRYLSARTDNNEYLFISYGHTNKQLTANRNPQSAQNKLTDSGKRTAESGMTPRSIQRMILKYSKAAGITKHVTPHTMRHSFATDLLMAGADLRSVQSLLGHSSVTTTQIYTHVTDQHLQEVHQAFHGRRREETKNTDNNKSSVR